MSSSGGTERVSIVIPCYNYGHLLGDAVDSALAQTHPPREVVVVDDGSSDVTREIAETYGWPVLYVGMEHSGVSAARNLGARTATGEFVVFLDADDILDPKYVATCMGALRAAPTNVAYAYTPVRYFGRLSGVTRASPFSIRTLRYGNYVNVSALLRAHVLNDVGFAEDLPGLEDFDFFLSLAERGWSGVRVGQPLLAYRKHDSSTDRMAVQWQSHFDTVIARHPSLYPLRVRLAIRAFRSLERFPQISRAMWRARHMFREVTSRMSGTRSRPLPRPRQGGA